LSVFRKSVEKITVVVSVLLSLRLVQAEVACTSETSVSTYQQHSSEVQKANFTDAAVRNSDLT